MTQSWRPFGVVPAGRKVQAGFVIEWSGGQVGLSMEPSCNRRVTVV